MLTILYYVDRRGAFVHNLVLRRLEERVFDNLVLRRLDGMVC